jgi:catechol-2,3-dioxygenase
LPEKEKIMTISESQQVSSSQLLPAATRLGHVHLTVADLEGQIAFYQQVLGLKLPWPDWVLAKRISYG